MTDVLTLLDEVELIQGGANGPTIKLRAGIAALQAAIVAMADDGWLMCGVEGMSSAQEICYAAYLTIKPPPTKEQT